MMAATLINVAIIMEVFMYEKYYEKVTSVDISANGSAGFFDITVLCQICFFVFKAAEPPFNHNIIRPAAFTIHTLPDAIFFHKIYIFLTCKRASLIRIQNPWFSYLKCLIKGSDDHSSV